MRDPEKLKKEREERNKLILDAAFKLFVERRIEAVSIQNVADEAGIGVATVFRYYANKPDLAIEVCANEWYKAVSFLEKDRPKDYVDNLTGLERLKYSLDFYIDLYREHKDLLIYNDNFNHYIVHEHVEESRLECYRQISNPVTERFHWMYEAAKVDKSFRTDIPEEKLLRITLHTMMSACIHYAGGIIWGASDDVDYTDELIAVRDMIIKYITEV